MDRSNENHVPIAKTPCDSSVSTDQQASDTPALNSACDSQGPLVPVPADMTATVMYPHAGTEQLIVDRTGEPGTIADGTLLKHFRIVRLIGRGGMGDVYEAHDESLERTVAIKVIRAGRNIAPAAHSRLVHEARAQASINHPHVVQIYYVGLEADCPFLAMEIVRGTTLAEALARRRFSFREIVRLALEIIKALSHASEMQIVHADIKPSNILLDESGTAKLSDFGLAQRNLTDIEHVAVLQGTPKYMAPELLGGARSSVASDMYSLGIMLFEMTVGRYPYDANATTIQQQFDQHRSAEISFPKPWPADVPDGWKDILACLLAKEPQNRYADYGRLQADVSRFEPTARLPAALLPRGLAWSIDQILLTLIFGIIGLCRFLLQQIPGGHPESIVPYLIGFGVNLLQFGVFGLLILAHARFQTTPGKRLFQISIADQHGLSSTPIRLMLRFVLSIFPFTSYFILNTFNDLTGGKLGWLYPAVAILNGVWLIGNIVSVLMNPRRLALHDRLLGTRAVVDHAK